MASSGCPQCMTIDPTESTSTTYQTTSYISSSMAGKFRGHSQWDPTLIIFQILTVQFLSYGFLSSLVLVATSLFDYKPSIMFIFNHSMMRLGTGKLVILFHLLNSGLSAYLLVQFVERAKSCLDFSITYYVIHFCMVWIYSGSIPDTFIWYFITCISACCMCIIGEILCRREEMKLIPILSSV